jgi:hypothetical protein
LPIGFVYNAIESVLIQRRLKKKGAQWYEGRSGHMIEMPLDSEVGYPFFSIEDFRHAAHSL